MNVPMLRSQVEEALRRLDDTQAFERMVRELLSADGWIIEPRGSRTRGVTVLGPDFRAWKSDLEFAGEIFLPARMDDVPAEMVRRRIGATSRRLRQEGVHPGRLLVVTSARLNPHAVAPRRRRPGARPKEDVLLLDGDWMVEKLLDPRNTRLLGPWLAEVVTALPSSDQGRLSPPR